ncbi:MAG TPA: FixH family protein [Polyangiaceae bacterium]|jgi:hypothetical protein
MSILVWTTAVALAIACGACSSASTGPVSFPADAFSTSTTDSGTLHVELRTSPQPPARGTIEAQLVITKVADDSPVDGLTVAIQPWMPAMNHGAIAPTVMGLGDGKYLVTELDVFMPGHWELRTALSGAMTDHVTPAFDIQ